MKTKYQVGDRVRFFGDKGCPPDVGVVTLVDPDEVLVKWDSDGVEQHFYSNDPNFEKILDTSEIDALKDRVARLEELVQQLSVKVNR